MVRLYRITIYRLYRYFGYTIHIVSFILVTRTSNNTFCLNLGYLGHYNFQIPVKFVDISSFLI